MYIHVYMYVYTHTYHIYLFIHVCAYGIGVLAVYNISIMIYVHIYMEQMPTHCSCFGDRRLGPDTMQLKYISSAGLFNLFQVSLTNYIFLWIAHICVHMIDRQIGLFYNPHFFCFFVIRNKGCFWRKHGLDVQWPTGI